MDKIKVRLDLSTVPHALGGISRYLLGFARGMQHVAADEGIEFSTIDIPAAHMGVKSPESDLILTDPLYLKVPFLRRIPIRFSWEPATRSRRLKKRFPCDVYHHGGVQPSHPKGSISFITMFDLSGIRHPDWHTPETVLYAAIEAWMITEGARILAISEWTARKSMEFFKGIEKRIGVIGGAADRIFTPGLPDQDILRSSGLRSNEYLLVVGNFVPRKNIPFILDVYKQARKNGFQQMPLVLAGAGGWNRPEMKGEGVQVLEAVSEETLLTLYRGCRAVLLPSLYEGLGFPALEAMACGAALISSNASALPETVGDGGILLPPDDGKVWLKTILQLEDKGFVQKLKNRSTVRVRIHWDDVARRACRFYRELSH